MFSQTNYMKQDSTKNHLTFEKTNLVSKYTHSLLKYAIHNINIKARVKNIIPSLF